MLQKLCCKTMLSLKRHSPVILTCMGVIGVTATTIMAVKATPKAVSLLEDAKLRKGEKLTKTEMVQAACPAYIPTMIMGFATISCIFGTHILNQRQQASLTSAYALLHQSYHRYRTAADSVYGEDADSRIRVQMAEDAYVSADGYRLYTPDQDQESEKVLFYDEYSSRYFTATMAAVLNAQYHVNRNLMLRGEVNVNEFYTFLGVDKIDGGNESGWDIYEMQCCGIGWLDFENKHAEMEDGLECIIISPLWQPDLLGRM